MKLYICSILLGAVLPITNPFLSTVSTTITTCGVAKTKSLIPIIQKMSDIDDDWHADYDPSKYEQSYETSDDSRYGYDDRQRGYGERRGRGGGRGRGSGGRGRGGGGRKTDFGPNGHDYELTSDAAPNNSRFSETEIHELLAERLQAKFARDFKAADNIQMGLIDGGVFVNDKLKEWRADGVPYGSFHDDGGGGRGGGGSMRRNDNQVYTKSEYSGNVEGGASDELINKLCHERTKFKMMRQYDKADKVREGLRTKFNVLIDDRLKQWSVNGDFGEEHNQQREIANTFANRGYIKSTSSLSLTEDEEEYIQGHVDARATAKKERNFDSADKIRLDLAQRFDVTINDKLKLWSIGGLFEELGERMGKPKGVYVRRGGGELSTEDEDDIAKMLMDRYHAKKQRNFDAADDIRETLMTTYNIRIDDRSNEWRVDTNDYAQSGDTTLTSADEAKFIDIKLKERFNLKRERSYEEADAIRDELKERFNVKVDDRTKEWFVDNEVESFV